MDTSDNRDNQDSKDMLVQDILSLVYPVAKLGSPLRMVHS